MEQVFPKEKKVLFLQPLIPHYREEFIERLSRFYYLKVYTLKSPSIEKANFKPSSLAHLDIRSFQIGKLLFYSLSPFVRLRDSITIIMFSPTHISSWFILIINKVLGKKTILWGHGISIKNYEKEKLRPNPVRKLMLWLSNGALLYTSEEKTMWDKELPKVKTFAFQNTLSGLNKIFDYETKRSIDTIKTQYGIVGDRIFIYCARFNEKGRRVDLLVDVIDKVVELGLPWSFIIIGEGKLKPDFSKYSNVYDFGAVYDSTIKSELFSISDIYFQPAWTGLSIVEAMAYGKPVLTFRRSSSVPQCVEYAYLQESYNAILLDSVDDFITRNRKLSLLEVQSMGRNARKYVEENLSMDNMVNTVAKAIKEISES